MTKYRIPSMIVALSLVLVGSVHADDGHSHETTSLVGEIVDMGCYLAHGATGEDHKSCALKCIAGGMPMGLLVEDGTVYLLNMNHDNADPFNEAKDLAAEMVKITGALQNRGGIQAIDVAGIELASADAIPTKVDASTEVDEHAGHNH